MRKGLFLRRDTCRPDVAASKRENGNWKITRPQPGPPEVRNICTAPSDGAPAASRPPPPGPGDPRNLIMLPFTFPRVVWLLTRLQLYPMGISKYELKIFVSAVWQRLAFLCVSVRGCCRAVFIFLAVFLDFAVNILVVSLRRWPKCHRNYSTWKWLHSFFLLVFGISWQF